MNDAVRHRLDPSALGELTDIVGPTGLVTDPEFSFFDTAKPYAKEFMLRREGRQFRRLMLDKLTGRDEGRVDWSRVWKLAKMAAKAYLEK